MLLAESQTSPSLFMFPALQMNRLKNPLAGYCWLLNLNSRTMEMGKRSVQKSARSLVPDGGHEHSSRLLESLRLQCGHRSR
jgi:hypothetical protein